MDRIHESSRGSAVPSPTRGPFLLIVIGAVLINPIAGVLAYALLKSSRRLRAWHYLVLALAVAAQAWEAGDNYVRTSINVIGFVVLIVGDVLFRRERAAN